MTTPIPSSSPRNKSLSAKLWAWGCFLIFSLSIAVYGRALRGSMIWEDDRLTRIGEDTLRDALSKPFLGVYFRPLTSLSFWIDHQLWHEEPFMYHQTNILIHALTTLVVIALLRAAFNNRAVALLGGLLFAVQPAQVSTVAWIGGRTDSLSTLLVALFAWTLVRGAQASQRAAWLTASVLFFLLAMLAKEQVVSLAPLVPLAFLCFGDRSRMSIRVIARLTIPFVAAAVLFLGMAYALGPGLPQSAAHDLPYKLLLAGRSTLYYTLLLFLPAPQWLHSFTVIELEKGGLVSAIAGYAILALAVALFIRWMRSAKPAAWFLAYTVLAVLPVLNLIPVGSLIVAPYRAGTPGLGAAALLAWLCVGLARRVRGSKTADQGPAGLLVETKPSAWRYVAAAIVALWFCGLTVWEVTQWAGPATILAATTRDDPGGMFTRSEMAAYLLGQKQPEQSARQVEDLLTWLFAGQDWRTTGTAARRYVNDPGVEARTLASNGDKRGPKTAISDLFTRLGYARAVAKRPAEAYDAFRTAEAFDPNNGSVLIAVGRFHYAQKQWDKAIPYLRRMVEEHPTVAVASNLLGNCYAALGRWSDAVTAYRLAVKQQPWDGGAHLSLSEALEKVGDREGARVALQAALQTEVTHEDEIRHRLAALTLPAQAATKGHGG